MHVWIMEIGEPLPGVDRGVRDWRCGMLSRAIVAHGHKVTWWASTFDHVTKRHRFDGPCTIETLPGLQINLLHGPGYGQNNSPKRLLHHRAVAAAFARESVVSSKPDVVFCCLPTLELAEQAVVYQESVGVPAVIDVRDLWPDHYLTLVPQELRGVFKLVLASEFRRVCRVLKGATGITAISNTSLAWALKYASRERGVFDGVFPMGYPAKASSAEVVAKQDELISRHKLRPDDLIVSFVGSFCSSYDLKTVIEAMRVLDQATQHGIRFVIVGDGDGGSELRALAQGLTNVVFTGWLDQISIMAVLGMSAVGLAPYRDNASMTLPNKPYEYMAAGLPILSSLHGELEVLIRDEQIGLQYQAGDVASLLSRLQWFAVNVEKRKAMGLRARKLFEERFSAEIVYPRLVWHLEKIVDQPVLG
jgi:glycosyltransferase involved in cell wall biosynthesis